jgi:hypothetical protein
MIDACSTVYLFQSDIPRPDDTPCYAAYRSSLPV